MSDVAKTPPFPPQDKDEAQGHRDWEANMRRAGAGEPSKPDSFGEDSPGLAP